MKDIVFSVVLIIIVTAAIVWMALYAVAACRLAPENTRSIIEVFVCSGIIFLLLESVAVSALIYSIRQYKNKNRYIKY